MSKKQLNVSAVVNELRGQSVFFQSSEIEEKPKEKAESAVVQNSSTPEVQQSGSSAVQKPSTAAVQNYSTPTLNEVGDYPLLDFRELKKVDVRLTWDQKEYLDDLEKLIARKAPGLEKNNPLSKRITRSAVIRVLVEITRRLALTVDPAQFVNERDLLKALTQELRRSLAKQPQE